MAEEVKDGLVGVLVGMQLLELIEDDDPARRPLAARLQDLVPSLRYRAALPLLLDRMQQALRGLGGHRFPIDELYILTVKDIGQTGPQQRRFADPRFTHHDDEGDLVIESQAQHLRQFVVATQPLEEQAIFGSKGHRSLDG